jgi:hypothetical protein
MKNKKKFIAVAVSLVSAASLLVGGAFAFFVDKDWTSDVGEVGTVYLNVEDLVFTNSENINPGDYDKDVYLDSVKNGSTSSLRTGTEHNITFKVDNVGTKSIMTRNVITITVENVTYQPVYYKDGESAYNKAEVVAPDNKMYYCDYANNPLQVVEDASVDPNNPNLYIKGTEVKYNQSTGKYEYVDAITKKLMEFDKNSTYYTNIVHWKVDNLPADVFYLLYDVKLAEESPDLLSAGVKPQIVVQSTEIDCIPSEGALHNGTDLYALHSAAIGAEFEPYPRTFFSSNSTAIGIRYVTPQISLAAPEGSIEDADGTGSEQTVALTQGGLVRENDLDTAFYEYWFAMDKDASNIYNGATVYIDIEVQGMQYRNTSDSEWKTLFNKTYNLTVENAGQSYDSIHENTDVN